MKAKRFPFHPHTELVIHVPHLRLYRSEACRISPEADSVLIFHAFAKKTQKTPPHEIAVAQERLTELLNEES